MKKSLFVLFMLVLCTNLVVTAQTPADLIKSAAKATKALGEKEKVAAAQTAVDAMMKAPENQTNWEALLTQGRFYNKLSSLDALNSQAAALLKKEYKFEYPKAGLSAATPLLAAMKATQDKKQLKEITASLFDAQNAILGSAGIFTDTKDYLTAYTCFKTSLDIHDVLKANSAKSVLDKPEDYSKQVYYAGLLSIYCDKEKESVGIYEQMIALKKDTSFVYSALYKAKMESDPAGAIKYLEEGRKKYPDDSQLLFAEINHYLKTGKLNILIDKLKAAIAKEPKNISLYFTLGNVFDNLSQQEKDAVKSQAYADEAMVYYKKTLELDSKNADAIYSIGAAFYNKAAAFTKELVELGKLPPNKENDKKYNEKEKQVLEMFDTALPYFQKAESINPNDQNTLIALKEIFAKKSDLKLSKEFKTRLDTVQGGGKNATSYFKQ